MARGSSLDANHKEIVEVLEKAGCSVLSLADQGGGCPDIVVGHHGRNFLLEIKNPKTAYGRKGLNPNQKKWAGTWNGVVVVVRSPIEALRAIGFEVSLQEEA